jgi:hypothetical protein
MRAGRARVQLGPAATVPRVSRAALAAQSDLIRSDPIGSDRPRACRRHPSCEADGAGARDGAERPAERAARDYGGPAGGGGNGIGECFMCLAPSALPAIVLQSRPPPDNGAGGGPLSRCGRGRRRPTRRRRRMSRPEWASGDDQTRKHKLKLLLAGPRPPPTAPAGQPRTGSLGCAPSIGRRNNPSRPPSVLEGRRWQAAAVRIPSSRFAAAQSASVQPVSLARSPSGRAAKQLAPANGVRLQSGHD